MKRMILGLLVCLAFATMASAEGTRFQQDRDDAPVTDTCGEIDAANPCYISVGSYLQCTAKGSNGQMCAKGFYEGTAYWCTWVSTSANCQCDVRLKRSDGMCTYYK